MTPRLSPHRAVLALLALVALSPLTPAQTQVTGWHAHGQTWIVWEDTTPIPASYRIFASTTDFRVAGTTDVGVQVGRLMEADWTGARLRLALPGGTYRVPGPGGGWKTLATDEGVFAYTPREASPLYFAVVKDGESAVTDDNGTELIAQTLDGPTAHLQGTRQTPSSGQTLHVFAHWLDGHADPASGRPGYPVMGNHLANGVGSVFLVTEPTGGLSGEALPAVVALHGGGGHYMNFIGGQNPDLGLTFDDALLITPDGTLNTWEGPRGCAWLGYWEGFDRFAWPPATSVPDGALVVDYAMRRVLWQIDWVAEQFPVDAARISLLGHSGGARGASQLARVYPERFAAAHLYCAAMATGEDDNPFFGSRDQNSTTTLPGAPGVADVADETHFPSMVERDAPFTRIVIGRMDTTSTAGWGPDKVQKFHALDALRMGRHLFFDERGHGVKTWGGAWFNGSAMLQASALLPHRVDRSYPAVFDYDQDPQASGRQPDMGNGDPLDGDPHGTFGGYVEWDRDSLIDLPAGWACTLWLRGGGTGHPADEFPGTFARVGIAVRRPQAFEPWPGTPVHWSLIRLADGSVLQSGAVLVDSDGLVCVEDLLVPKDPERVRLLMRSVVALPTK